MAEELQRRGWSNAHLEQLRKADSEKLAIARRLRAETTVTFQWIAERLRMGAAGYVSNCLRTAKQLTPFLSPAAGALPKRPLPFPRQPPSSRTAEPNLNNPHDKNVS